MEEKLNIVIVGPAYPYRGGIAAFNEMLARTFIQRGHEVRIVTFRVQYPSFLFPGKTQFSTSPAPPHIPIVRMLNSVNPFNWIATARKIRRQKPDLIIMKYWTPFMAPSLGTVARLAGRNTPVVVSVDNIVPHEHNIVDRPFNRYFIKSVDGFVYMSREVGADLEDSGIPRPALFSPHPVYEGYGDPVEKRIALERLGLDDSFKYAMFFGLVRDYKGLDILLDGWEVAKGRGCMEGWKLIVAGEFYSDRERYLQQVSANGLEDEVVIKDYFIPDDEVKYWFSAADLVVQPYKTATQSGVTQIAYNFDLPMIVTRVGGLAEIVPDGKVGYVCPPDPEGVADALCKYVTEDKEKEFIENIREEKKRFSWSAMADKLFEVYQIIKKGRE